MKSPTRAARLLTAAAVAFLVACSSSGDKANDEPWVPPAGSLPFHVAVIPLDPPAGAVSAEELEDSTARLDVAADRLSRAITHELDGGVFTRATLLERPVADGEVNPASWSEDEWNDYWARTASLFQADLILESHFEFSPGVDYRRNNGLWLEIPLFLVGGPFCWFVDGRSYTVDARLRSSLHDLNPIYLKRCTLASGLAQVTDASTAAGEVKMDFTDRADSWGTYVPTILIPPSFRDGDPEVVAEKLAADVAADLADGLSRGIAGRSQEVIVADHLAPYYFRPGVKAVREGGRIHIIGEVVLLRGEVEKMGQARVKAGDRIEGGSFNAGLRDESLGSEGEVYLRYPVAMGIDASPDVQYVIVELADAGEVPTVRSYTLPVLDGGLGSVVSE